MEPIANRQRQRQGIDRAEQRARTGEIPRGNSRPKGTGAKEASGAELPPLKERRAREFAWAAEHLPNEHTGSVVAALIGLEVAGEKQSTASVMARLERQGRTKAQGWIR
jgi:hypothetical protein